ncbi:Periplasmic pH-dependent serine endoprotease DegQ precursor [Providencia rustigianii]|uniref:Peptidase Do n=3 Tax=Morganellaceae TaxID=1903414 RepID=D1P1U3_9GAMM|nr:peptidase Do [Providencia rustigianii DSM 4541]MTC56564.1 Do family serine endopeptidase [Providencia rustigianii]SPY78785.1 Periplasmic pH-dependent serine endoprotease DegQ precursor [Providencia rustigianii]SUC28463.1 Periplasmic pH-dependent serine endoprotease DegQ precursor [Providencia rustigianii]SUC36771.1 Periplasmic pH-dependent serine endoprotease DegQ precursor [Providencia rustigianii]
MMKRKNFFLTAVAMSLGLTLATIPAISSAALPATLPTSAQSQNMPSLAPMLEKVLPAVVNIHVSGTRVQTQQIPDELKFFFGPNTPSQQQSVRPFEGLGSGVIIDATQGYVLTNNHVIDGADKIQIQLNDGREIDVKLIGKDPQTDIALLKISNAKDIKNLTAVSIADSDKLRVGDFAVAVGNPFGLGQTATSGIISALGRSGLNLEGLENFIQTDASINRGNSGGALVNLNGELIGINTAILAPGGGNIGIGFAIPSNMAKSLSEQLIKHGEVKRGILGIKGTEMNSDIAKAFNIDAQRGAFVSEVIPKSSAAKAGIKSGDVLVSVDGKRINSFAELRAKIGTSQLGKEITLGLIRSGKPMEVKVVLDSDEGSATKAEKLSESLLGATISNAIVSNTKGVQIDNVAPKSPAALVGLVKGDLIFGVNDARVENIEQFRKIIESKPPVLAMKVLRGGETLYLLMKN